MERTLSVLNQNPPGISATRSFFCIVLLFAFVATLRIGAESDLHEGDQPKQADYVLDIVTNSHWLVQHHANGSIMSKPPLYNWIAAPFVMLFGPEDVLLKMPSLLAGLSALIMAWDLIRRRLGERAALWGCVFLLLTSMFAKQMYYARTDMMLACFTVMQFWTIARWEESGSAKTSFRSGWVWLFWTATGLGNFTKGPLALLPLLGIFAYWLSEGRLKERSRGLGIWWGLPLSLLPVAIWFFAAQRSEGTVVFEHLVRGEMLDRFKSDAEKSAEDKSNRPIYYYLPQVIGRTLPWSLFALVGLWSALTAKRNAAINETECSTIRLLAIWFLSLLIFWSLVPSKRVDRIFPAIPAFALLAGWAFDQFLKWSAEEMNLIVRIQRQVMRASSLLIAGNFVLAGVGLAALALGAHSGPFKALRKLLPAVTLENLAAAKVLACTTCGVMAAGGIAAVVMLSKKRLAAMACALVACNMALFTLYQQVLGNWMQSDYFAQGSSLVCREVRKRVKADGGEVLILSASGASARFYLLQWGLPLQTKDAIARLAAAHGPLYVIGAQPYFESDAKKHAGSPAKKRSAGSLELTGLGDVPRIPVAGVATVKDDTDLPSVKILAAVFVPERK